MRSKEGKQLNKLEEQGINTDAVAKGIVDAFVKSDWEVFRLFDPTENGTPAGYVVMDENGNLCLLMQVFNKLREKGLGGAVSKFNRKNETGEVSSVMELRVSRGVTTAMKFTQIDINARFVMFARLMADQQIKSLNKGTAEGFKPLSVTVAKGDTEWVRSEDNFICYTKDLEIILDQLIGSGEVGSDEVAC